MCDNLRRFRSIKKGLTKLLPFEPTGNLARHLETLTFLINGIVAGQNCNLTKVAAKTADSRKPESRVKSFSRWLTYESVDYTTYYLPYAELLLRCLATKPLALIFDSSGVGRNCVALVASVVYKNRALPISWIVRKGTKGHFPEELHLELARLVYQIIPADTQVIFLGDGEFDETNLITLLKSYGWLLACRTAKNRILLEENEFFTPRTVGVGRDNYSLVPDVSLANDPSGELINLVVWWKCYYENPIYLLTNIEPIGEALYWYKKRFRIETFFSDQKSRGFNIHKSHISEPERLEKLLIATCLAYIWIVFLGALAIEKGWHTQIHRTDRCDLSLFQLGLRLMDHRLNMAKSLPFQLNLFGKFIKSVR